MLFFLTGDIQTGKTRWLEKTIAILAERGIVSAGVIAPGIWIEDDRFIKLGIDNVLLPQGERITFALREDIAKSKGAYDANAQSASAGLHWAIDEDAIKRVNNHFEELLRDAETPRSKQGELLVVDELGRLELMRGGGLTAAVTLLKQGAGGRFRHGVVIVRDSLLDVAKAQLPQAAWGGFTDIYPNDDSLQKLLSSFSSHEEHEEQTR